jgi:ankyrin repeat protein
VSDGASDASGSGEAAGLTPEELAFLAGLFDHARTGATGPLTDAIDRGVPVNLTNGSGDTLLILAAYHTHEETVRALLERGADHGRVNDKGQTALAAAVFRQSEPVVRLLLEAGADPAAGPRSALAVAEFFDLPAMAALLRQPGD